MLVMWVGRGVKEPSLKMECLLVTLFQIFGYNAETCLPAILRGLPSVKFLYSNVPLESGEVVLEHPSVESIEVAYNNVYNLRLVMSSLVQVGLAKSCVRIMQVTSTMGITVETYVSCGNVNIVIPDEEMKTSISLSSMMHDRYKEGMHKVALVCLCNVSPKDA